MAVGRVQRLPRFAEDGRTVVPSNIMSVSLGADHRWVGGWVDEGAPCVVCGRCCWWRRGGGGSFSRWSVLERSGRLMGRAQQAECMSCLWYISCS